MTGRTGLAVSALAAFVLVTASAAWAQDYLEMTRRDAVAVPPGEKIVFQSTTPLTVTNLLEGSGQATAVNGYLQLPEKLDGPVPAVIIFNCGDTIKRFKELTYAEELRKQGYAVFLVNSFANRGDYTDPADFFRLRHAAAVDALMALKTLAEDRRIDTKRIAILGWATGGMYILSAAIEELRLKYVGGDAKFAAIIAIQPWCGIGTLGKSYSRTPILILTGERDDFLPPEHCQAFRREALQAGANMQINVYPGAGHNWDLLGPLQYRSSFPSMENCTLITYLATREVRLGDGQVILAAASTANTRAQLKAYWQSCKRSGHLHGGHEVTRVRALADVKAFLVKAFAAADN